MNGNGRSLDWNFYRTISNRVRRGQSGSSDQLTSRAAVGERGFTERGFHNGSQGVANHQTLTKPTFSSSCAAAADFCPAITDRGIRYLYTNNKRESTYRRHGQVPRGQIPTGDIPSPSTSTWPPTDPTTGVARPFTQTPALSRLSRDHGSCSNFPTCHSPF